MNRSGVRKAVPTARFCLVIAALATAPLGVQAADEEAFSAHPAVRYELKDRCPQLRETEEGSSVVVLFLVDASGHPSRARIRTPSGLEGLDAEALRCVAKLKFQPATRPGDAVPVMTWQQLQLRWASPQAQAAAAGPAAAVAAPAALAASSTAAASVVAAAPAAGGTAAPVTEVHVCADASGTLTQEPRITRSSGDAARDAAAVRIARAGAGNYATAAGKPGCGRLAVSLEAQQPSPGAGAIR